jgi:hypothetical protein
MDRRNRASAGYKDETLLTGEGYPAPRSVGISAVCG